METGFADLILRCFGGFRLEVEGEEITNFGTNKARALLVYLAIEAPRSFRRSHLAGLFWSEYTETQALHNLRQTVFWLRKSIPHKAKQPPLLITVQDTIGINPDINFWVDVKAFQSAYHTALKFFSKDQRFDRLDILRLEEAIGLFKSPFLDRFALDESQLFDEWVLTLRESTNQKASEIMTLLCEYHERRADYVHASELADRIIELTPWDETAYAHSMRLYAVRKQWGPAKKRYHQLRDYYQDSFSIEPEPSITDLFEQIRSLSLINASLSPSTPTVKPHLPDLLPSFFGRKIEMNELVGMFADPKIRLVTMIGMGGIGKTRLAIELGHLLHGLYLHGVFFIPLHGISSLAGLVHLVAETLDLLFSNSAPHQRQLMDYLREKRCLLIMDCFEHLLAEQGTCEFLAELLAYAPGMKLLVTSRERLNLQEEHVFLLSGLYSYHETAAAALERGSSDALALFMDRARRGNHQFTLDPQTLLLAHKLCQIVEGHPLSIELMASATNALAIPDLLFDLETSLLAIKSPILNGSSEQRSLPAVLERSWRYLTENQKTVMCKLACFRGGFTEKAAIEVAQTNKTILSALVDKCFLRIDRFTHYNLHQIIRQFARQKSVEANLYQATLYSHATYYIALLDDMAENNPCIYTEDVLEQIDADLVNFKDAWHYFIENKQSQRLSQSVEPLYQFFNIRSRFQEGIDLFQEAFQLTEESHQGDTLNGKLAIRIGSLAHRLRHDELAFQMFSRAMKTFRDSSDVHELGLALIGFGSHYLRAKQFKLALQYAQESLACFQEVGNLSNQAAAYELLGLIANRTADFSRAKEMLTLSIRFSRQLNDRRGMISVLNQLGDLACNEGDFIAAERYFLESLEISRSFKDRFNQAILLNNLASVYRPQKAYEQEAQVLLESMAICRDIGDRDGEAIALNNVADLAVIQGNYPLAIDYCERALDIALPLGEDWTTIVIYDILGEAHLGLGEIDSAKKCFTKALQLAYQIDAWDLVTRVMVNSAGLFLSQGDHHTAEKILQAALSHPGILYEYKQKALPWIKLLGLEIPENQNDGYLMEVMDHVYNLPSLK